MTKERYSKEFVGWAVRIIPIILGLVFFALAISLSKEVDMSQYIHIAYYAVFVIVINDYGRHSSDSQETTQKILQKKIYSSETLTMFKQTKYGLYVTIGVLVASGVSIFLFNFLEPSLTDTKDLVRYLTYAQLASIASFAILFYQTSISFFKRNVFQYHITRISFEITSVKKDDVDQMRYVILGLDSYNKYLQRAFTLQINEVDRIYDFVARRSQEGRTKLIKSIVYNLNLGKLEAIRYLFSKLSQELEIKTLLVNQGYRKKIKEYLDVIIPIVSIAIAILTTITGLIGY